MERCILWIRFDSILIYATRKACSELCSLDVATTVLQLSCTKSLSCILCRCLWHGIRKNKSSAIPGVPSLLYSCSHLQSLACSVFLLLICWLAVLEFQAGGCYSGGPGAFSAHGELGILVKRGVSSLWIQVYQDNVHAWAYDQYQCAYLLYRLSRTLFVFRLAWRSLQEGM